MARGLCEAIEAIDKVAGSKVVSCKPIKVGKKPVKMASKGKKVAAKKKAA